MQESTENTRARARTLCGHVCVFGAGVASKQEREREAGGGGGGPPPRGGSSLPPVGPRPPPQKSTRLTADPRAG
eukprot:COSAG06_NODE_7673_length_2418_cov_12.693834_7_plen_73_part_01